MADIMESITDLRKGLLEIQNRINNPRNILPPEYFRGLIQENDLGQVEELLMFLTDIQSSVNRLSSYLDGLEEADEEEYSPLTEDILHRLHIIRNQIIHIREGHTIERKTAGLDEFAKSE